MLGLLQLLTLGFVIALAFATWLVVDRLRRPTRRTYAWAVARSVPGDPSELDEPREFTQFEITLDGAACTAWDIPADNPGAPLVVCSPGWGDSKIGVLARIGELLPVASRIIAWDSPGLGETDGKCPLGTREPRMLLRLARDVREDAQPVVLLGWSLGAGNSIAAAALDAQADTPIISGVVAEAPYRQPWTPAFSVIRMANLPWRVNGPIAFALMGLRLTAHPTWRDFDRASQASRTHCPILVIHGTADEICPYADAQAIASRAPDATLIPVPGAGHNNLWTAEPHRAACAGAVSDFLAVLSSPAPHPPQYPPPQPLPHEPLH